MSTPGTTTRTYRNATLTGPEGPWLTLVITGEDTPADLTDMSAQLLSIGSEQNSSGEDVVDGVEFASLECNDDVEFHLNGARISMEQALDLIAVGIRVALEDALKATPTA